MHLMMIMSNDDSGDSNSYKSMKETTIATLMVDRSDGTGGIQLETAAAQIPKAYPSLRSSSECNRFATLLWQLRNVTSVPQEARKRPFW